MSSTQPDFVSACLDGLALLEDIDDWVDAWHDSLGEPRGHQESLDSFLGMTPEEGALWAEKPAALRFVVAARATNRLELKNRGETAKVPLTSQKERKQTQHD